MCGRTSLYLDAEDAARRLTPFTKAIMPVHYASGTVGLDAIYAFAAKYKLRVLEDAAHSSLDGDRHGRKVGAEEDVGLFQL